MKLPKLKLPKLPKLAEVRKAVVPALAFLGELVSLGVLHGRALEVATAALGVAATLGVYRIKNAPKA